MNTIRRIAKGEGMLYREMRLAALADAPEAFSTTYESAFQRPQESWTDQADASAEGSSRFTFFALIDGTPVGLAALYRDEETSNRGEMIQVWISPGHRGSGIANELVHFIFQYARENRFETITAEIMVPNPRALRFYQKHGFVSDSSVPVHSDSSIVLSKRL